MTVTDADRERAKEIFSQLTGEVLFNGRPVGRLADISIGPVAIGIAAAAIAQAREEATAKERARCLRWSRSYWRDCAEIDAAIKDGSEP